MKIVNLQIYEVQQTTRGNMKKTTPIHIIIKLIKISDKRNIERGRKTKDKNDSRFLARDNVSEKIVENHI